MMLTYLLFNSLGSIKGTDPCFCYIRPSYYYYQKHHHYSESRAVNIVVGGIMVLAEYNTKSGYLVKPMKELSPVLNKFP